MNEEQYRLTCARRNALRSVVWQTPILASATQAFLLAPAFNPGIGRGICLVLAFFSFAVGIASIQLMLRHHRLDDLDREMLARFEDENAGRGYAPIHAPAAFGSGPLDRLAQVSSFGVWIAVLAGFCLLALFAAWSVSMRTEQPPTVAAPSIAQPYPKGQPPSRIQVSPAKPSN
jgi:hypothetical protein